MEAAAKNLTPVTLELGGKSPCIVGRSANIRLAARRIMWGKLLAAGQTCVAPDYLLVHRDLKEGLCRERSMRSGSFSATTRFEVRLIRVSFRSGRPPGWPE